MFPSGVIVILIEDISFDIKEKLFSIISIFIKIIAKRLMMFSEKLVDINQEHETIQRIKS
jgi:hypothetical protein